ncbi:MAG: DUF6064 family protein [Melioribacteraceae bacterium]|nr:DUF6064 family protein [Melioribacteraceae bacterium]MCF8353376.1 DUF6064 family protein [Melioribacteraceae bacterium]MCF8393045.1 DUF6064 family protein [Melioribacteraceae bacterium]MCF8419102.1 DUF6064 family protein [Melioribacteraceae bacterium]
MNMPFTTNQFLEVLKLYNEAVFPLQIIFNLMAIAAIYLIFKRIRLSGKIISSILAFFWLWIGIAYHLVFFTEINKAAYGFGVLNIMQGGIFIYFGLLKNELTFEFKKDGFSYTGIIFFLYALIIYPVLGYLFGHEYPYSPTFGLPCPTTIFTFGMLLFIDKKIKSGVYLIPLIWSLIGAFAAFNMGIYEDYGLLAAGIIGTILLAFKNKKKFSTVE